MAPPTALAVTLNPGRCVLRTILVLLLPLVSVNSARPGDSTTLPHTQPQGIHVARGNPASNVETDFSNKLVCWKSSDHGGYPSSTPPNTDGVPGVAVIGKGCSRCVAGATCSFTISISSPANWLAPPSESQRRELNVEMVGPAVHAPLLAPSTTDDSSFLVTYRVWDAGVYRLSIRSSCGTLNYTADPKQERPHEMATWQLLVDSPSDEENVARVLLATSATGAELSSIPDASWALSSPCARGQFGRWLRDEQGKLTWTPFPCAGYANMAPDQWVMQLNKKGIYEINFVGDSHQRALMMHLRFLISGEVDMSHRRAHHEFSYVVRGKGCQLKLNFEWMAGIYASGTELGCTNEGRGNIDPKYPKETPAADAWVVEAGYWTGQYCPQPESALATYLPQFLLWAKTQVANSTNNPDRLGRKGALKLPIFAYRPTPPRDTEDRGCANLFTNKYVRAANSIERTLVPHFGAVLFDSFEMEAARFRSHCPRDHHFSCPFQVRGTTDKFYMGGDVGEADAIALVYFLLNQ